ncbi:hypothetical protein VKT23_010807 [Stygiomarasmius scandens]|uniref:Uncharacterized protein n=1 Tax=Marasmiellus scandens TaxID=2682957 RepID=A0ABR1JFE0_9AGAR
MRFVTAAAIFGLVAASPFTPHKRQNTDQFGTVEVSPTTFGIGDSIKVTYSATTARFPPDFIDFYLRGQFPSQPGAVEFTPFYLLSRNDYPAGEETFVLETIVPRVPTSASNWQLWTDVIFPGSSNNTLEVGSIPVSVTITPD